MSSKGFRFPFIADVRDWLKGTSKIEDSLDQVADTLDSVGDDSTKLADKIGQAMDGIAQDTKDAGDAGTDLDKSFSKAFKKVRDDAKKTGDKIGKDVKDGTEEASKGIEDFKEEAEQNAKEAAASFSGEFDDVADYIRELAAQAFAGFGPAGAAAGIAAAIGIGTIISSLEAGAEKAAAMKDRIIELGTTLAEADGSTAALDWAEELQTTLNEIVNEKRWYEFWQSTPETRLEEWARAAQELGIDLSYALQGMAGDTEAWEASLASLNERITQAYEASGQYASGAAAVAAANAEGAGKAQRLRDQLIEQKDVFDESAQYADLLSDALSGISDEEQKAAEATAEYEAAVADSLTRAGQSWDKYTTDGIVNLDAYNQAIEAQQQAIVAFETNLTQASQDLSAEALQYVQSLGPEAAPLLQAFVDAPLEEKARTAANWDTLGKAANDGYEQSVKLDEITQKKIKAAQSTADTSPISVKTLIKDDLARQLQSVIANVRPPTIPIYLQVQKEVN